MVRNNNDLPDLKELSEHIKEKLDYDIKFTELGTNYIYGIINDHVTIDALKKPKKATDKVRYIENETRLSHKVIVVK